MRQKSCFFLFFYFFFVFFFFNSQNIPRYNSSFKSEIKSPQIIVLIPFTHLTLSNFILPISITICTAVLLHVYSLSLPKKCLYCDSEFSTKKIFFFIFFYPTGLYPHTFFIFSYISDIHTYAYCDWLLYNMVYMLQHYDQNKTRDFFPKYFFYFLFFIFFFLFSVLKFIPFGVNTLFSRTHKLVFGINTMRSYQLHFV
jgi:hypothetical protein